MTKTVTQMAGWGEAMESMARRTASEALDETERRIAALRGKMLVASYVEVLSGWLVLGVLGYWLVRFAWLMIAGVPE